MNISEIRSMSKTKLAGTAIKCSISCLLYFTINLIFTYLLKIITWKVPNLIGYILQITFWIISIPFSYGIISNIIKISDSESTSVTNFLDEFILNFVKYTKLILHEIFRLIIPIILCIVSLAYLIGTFTAYINSKQFLCFYKELLPLAIIVFIIAISILIYFLLNYAIISYIYYNSDNKNNSKQILNKSKELMKGKKIKFILLLLSFLPYLIFTAIILILCNKFIEPSYLTPLVIVLYTIIKPYVTISKLMFTEELGDKK